MGEVFDGYSVEDFNGTDIYIKHLNIRDQRYIHKYYEKYRTKALARGLEPESKILERLREDDLWSEKEDVQIASLRTEMANLKKTKEVTLLPSKKEVFQKSIDEKNKELFKLLNKKTELVGVTAEYYASSRSGDEMLRFSLFDSPDCKNYLYDEEEFSELEPYEVAQLSKLILEVSQRISEDNVRRAVLRPFFSMYLSNCDNVSDFYGKAIVDLTIHQLKVAIYGKVFHSIFQYVDDIPDNIKEDPDKLIAFSENQRNKDSSKSGINDDADASAVFGATKEDLREVAGNAKTIDLSSEVKKAGGKLDMKQMMKLAGHDV